MGDRGGFVLMLSFTQPISYHPIHPNPPRKNTSTTTNDNPGHSFDLVHGFIPSISYIEEEQGGDQRA